MDDPDPQDLRPPLGPATPALSPIFTHHQLMTNGDAAAYFPRHRRGWTTAAAPPPRRTGSATATSPPPGQTRSRSRPRSRRWGEGMPGAAGPRPMDRRGTPARPGSPAVLRCDARGAASASGRVMPRSIRLTRICSTVVMMVAPPGRAERQERPAVRAARSSATSSCAAACRAPAGSGRGAALGRGEVEVGQLVVEQEAPAGHDHGVAAGLLDGQGVLDDVAPPVGHGQVRGALCRSRSAAPAGAVAQPPVGAVRHARRDRLGQRAVGSIRQARSLAYCVAEQLAQQSAARCPSPT